MQESLSGEAAVANADVEALRSLVDQVEALRAEAAIERTEVAEINRTVRWLDVRMMVLEQAAKDMEAEAASLVEKLQLCVEDVRAQDERLDERLAQVEEGLRDLDRSAGRRESDIIDLRAARNEASERLEELAASLVMATEQAETLALRSQQVAAGSAEEADRVAQSVAEVRSLTEDARSVADSAHDRVSDVVHDVAALADTVESNDAVSLARIAELREVFAEQLAVQSSAASDALLDLRAETDKVSAAAEERVAALEVDLRAETDKVSAAAEERVAALASDLNSREVSTLEKVAALRAELDSRVKSSDARHRERIEALQDQLEALLEDHEEVRVLAEKAKSRADYAADSTDQLQADLERQIDVVRRQIKDRATHSSLAELDESLESLRAQLNALTAGVVVASADSDGPGRPAKRWQAHLPEYGRRYPRPRALKAADRDDDETRPTRG